MLGLFDMATLGAGFVGAVRGLVRSPGLAPVVIAANAAVVFWLDGVLLPASPGAAPNKPLPSTENQQRQVSSRSSAHINHTDRQERGQLTDGPALKVKSLKVEA